MARKATATVKLNDGLNELLSSIQKSVTAMPVKPIKKTDLAGIAVRIKTEEDALIAGSKAGKEAERALKESATVRQENIRLDLATAFSNIPAKELKDRSSKEATDAIKGKMVEIRYALNAANYPVEKLDKKYVTKAGKAKWSMFPSTSRSWNIGSQLVRQIELFGWDEVCPGGKPLPHAEVQRWSLDEDGNIVKEKDAEQGKAATTNNDPVGAVEAAIHTLIVRLKKVGLDSEAGQKLADTAMMKLATEKASAMAAANLAKK